jgi:hypothetical protein
MRPMAPLEADFQFYRDNQADLVARYDGRFVVIRQGAVIGDYPTYAQAYAETVHQYPLGTFLIQLVEAGEGGYTQSFHSRVA